jgi:hypothetical protein
MVKFPFVNRSKTFQTKKILMSVNLPLCLRGVIPEAILIGNPVSECLR